ncbi:hypothetical protein GGQ99_004800 [Aminobacter niigataensis]|uniref:Uncharacterized protein n=1 Tax=Aminobacter niigataensis TaxID=83265 RepID=A0ABR6L8Q8_9HYPH|nr:hypothetical protein [Aminobacter niigataensis]MBB4653016.1 hypothetical protein [Aminobacter niigataensis]
MTKAPETDAGFVDITGFAPVDTIRYEVLKPGTTVGTGWFIEIADESHPNAMAWSNELARKNLKRRANLEAQQLNGRKIKAEERDPEEQKRENIGWVVSRIVGWTPVKLAFISPDPITYSEDAAYKVFMHPKMGWALGQLVDVIGDEKAFTKALPKP